MDTGNFLANGASQDSLLCGLE